MRRAMVKLLLLISVMLLSIASLTYSATARADKPAWEVFLPNASQVGTGQFRWWGFLVYDASLWAPFGEYRSGRPFALSLRYARSISKADIVKASIDQMRDLGFPVQRHPEWTQKLNQVMESVSAGDTLTGIYMPDQGAVFFYNDQLTGQVDEQLAEAFFAIWLSPKTTAPDLRQALLGKLSRSAQ
ncbi:chalcone isomerase family protein [Orrella daihaiensis]|uniref:Chalcone isomerase family protein n=1 Tax=Orrella daihaiensis TaxID=2782176 RepID=A0ABY4AKX1_9BURK|nr:chalcone isomerase family protein [Orrella daihaiensis]UOD49750.1 chalcone isomerase family protein [Orrella daihaiensis]